MEDKSICCYDFGEFRLDARRRSLSKDGEKVPLSARNFDLLLFMIENGGRVLEHDELLDKVWAGTFVEQATLKKGISALRQILGESPENEYIKTIPRRGYSFISPVRVVPEESEIVFVRETETIIEQLEVIDDEKIEPDKHIVEITPHDLKSLPSASAKKFSFTRLAVYAAAIVVLTVAIFGLKSYWSKSSTPQFSVENVRVNRLTNSGKVLAGAVISPDGNYLLYPLAEKDGAGLWIRQMSSNSSKRLTTPVDGSFWGFAVAPDNSYVYYIVNVAAEPQKSGLFRVSMLGGEPQKIQENISTFSISPDGKRIALVRLNSETIISTVNTDGEDERAVTKISDNLRLLGISWTPDGNALLCTWRKANTDKPLFYISEITPENGAETVVLPPQDKIIFGAAWMPDKSAIMLTMREPNADLRQIWQFFPASQEWRRVTNDDNSYKVISLPRDGKSIVSIQESRLAAIWTADNLTPGKKSAERKSLLNNSDNFRQVTDGVNNFDWLGWLADNRLMYSTTDDSKEAIFTINADGQNPHQVTSGGDGMWTFPSVGGNGQNICFLSSRLGMKQAWRIDADGKNLTRLTQTEMPVSNAKLLRDNSTVLFTSQKGNDTFLYKQTADGQITRLTDLNTGAFAVSPDETMFAAELPDEKTGKVHVALRSLIDGKTLKTFDFQSQRQLVFSPDGKYLAYDQQRGDVSQIMIQPLEDGGEPYALTDFQTDIIFSFGWSNDGSRLAVIRGKQLTDAVLIKTDSPLLAER